MRNMCACTVHVHVHVYGLGNGHGHGHGRSIGSLGLVCSSRRPVAIPMAPAGTCLRGRWFVQRPSSMPYSPRLSCEQVEANLAWVAESATVGPALWAEARATGLLGEEVPLPRY